MSVEMTSGIGATTNRSGHPNYEPIALYDTVDGMAFGPTFEDRAEAEAFIRWIERTNPLQLQTVNEIRHLNYDGQKVLADEWRALLAEHDEAQCPYDVDVDSYGIGFTGDTDKSYGDYTMATPDACQCECHVKATAERALAKRDAEVKNG